jgi:DNA-binding XRE family transcriptional regulator
MKIRRQVEIGEKTDLRTGRSVALMEPYTVRHFIGNEVRRLRRTLELTGSELGAATGISAAMLSRIENGSASPSAATIKSLAKALNVPVSQLLGEVRERADCSFVKAGFGVPIHSRGP